MIELFTLLVELGRIEGDDLPKTATGGAMILFTPAIDEETAVRETVALLKDAGLNPLEVTNYGTMSERKADGYEFTEEEETLAEEALEIGAIIIIEKQVFYDEDDDGERH